MILAFILILIGILISRRPRREHVTFCHLHARRELYGRIGVQGAPGRVNFFRRFGAC